MVRRDADDPALAQQLPPHLELWLDQQQHPAVILGHRDQWAHQQPQRDERDVGDRQIDGNSSDIIEVQVAEIGSFMQPDSRVGPQLRCQLPAADVHGNHLAAAAGQQDLSEASCRGAGIEGSSRHAELEVIERSDELVGTA